MALSPLEQFAQLAAAVGLGGLLSKGLSLWAGRARSRQKEPADLIKSLSALSGTLSDGTEKLFAGMINELGHLRGQIDELRHKVDECEGRHEGCEARVAEVTARLDASERERAERDALIAKMLADHPPAADYAPKSLSGVTPARNTET